MSLDRLAGSLPSAISDDTDVERVLRPAFASITEFGRCGGLVKLAYVISAYKYPRQIVRLVDKLDVAGASFFLHVDRNTEDAVFELVRGSLSTRANVFFLRRHRCYWGDFGHVRATLKGIEAIHREGAEPDYVVLLTGQDYPIKSNERIFEVLGESEQRSYLDSFPLPAAGLRNGGMDRIDRWHFHPRGRHLAFPEPRRCRSELLTRLSHVAANTFPVTRGFPDGFRPYAGSSYWCLARECVDYIRRFVRENRGFVRYFRHVRIPDELFFQTILLNSPMADHIVNDNLRYLAWDADSPARPRILTVDDFDQFISTKQLFARKFDEAVDADVLDMIDRANAGGSST